VPKIEKKLLLLYFKRKVMQFKTGSIMKINGYRRFDFPARFYDERKVQLESKRLAYEKQHELAAKGEHASLLREKISGSWVRNDDYRRSIFNSNLRLLVILGVLLLVILTFAGMSDLGSFIERMKNG